MLTYDSGQGAATLLRSKKADHAKKPLKALSGYSCRAQKPAADPHSA